MRCDQSRIRLSYIDCVPVDSSFHFTGEQPLACHLLRHAVWTVGRSRRSIPQHQLRRFENLPERRSRLVEATRRERFRLCEAYICIGETRSFFVQSIAVIRSIGSSIPYSHSSHFLFFTGRRFETRIPGAPCR